MSLSNLASTATLSKAPFVTSMSALDDALLSSLDRRTAARCSGTPKDVWVLAEKAKEMLGNPGKYSVEQQNASILRLVKLCGSENKAATLLGKGVSFVQRRCFEASIACKSLRAIWPETEAGLLQSMLAKFKARTDILDQYLRPWLAARVGQQIVRSEFLAEWERGLNGGLLPIEKVIQEKTEAESLAELALNDAAAFEAAINAERENRLALEAKVAAMEQAMVAMKGGDAGTFPEDLRVTVENMMRGKYTCSLEGLLRYAEFALADRLVILDSAWKSARESDNAGFRLVEAVADMLFALARDGVDQCRRGGHHKLTSVLGARYAESEGTGPMSDDGFKRRTFSYKGSKVEMMEHIRLGKGWNKGETFRAHFFFDGEEGKIVIGHFGKHLDR